MAGKRSGYMPISRMARLGPFNINISAGYLHLRMTHVLSPQSLGPGWRECPPARACPALRGLAPKGAADTSCAPCRAPPRSGAIVRQRGLVRPRLRDGREERSLSTG